MRDVFGKAGLLGVRMFVAMRVTVGVLVAVGVLGVSAGRRVAMTHRHWLVTEQCEGDEAGHVVNVRVAGGPGLLEVGLAALPHMKAVHRDEHGSPPEQSGVAA
jgi:hypothetical protein